MATVAPTPRSTKITLASATAGPFLLGFRLFDADSLEVYVNGAPRSDWTLTANFDAGYDDDASLTFTADLAPADEVTIDGAQVAKRDADYLVGDPGLTRKLNIELARMWAGLAELKRGVSRSLRSTTSTLPFTPEEGRTIIFDGDGNPIVGPSATEIAYANGAGITGSGYMFSNISALLADTTLSYDEGDGVVQISAGTIVQTRSEHVSYVVLAEASSAWSVETAGGVKLQPLVNSTDELNLVQIGGKKGQDVTDDLKAAVAYLTANGGGVIRVPRGTFYLSDTITITAPIWIHGQHAHFRNDYTDDPTLLGSWLKAAPGMNKDMIRFTGDPALIAAGEYPRIHAGMRDIGINGNRSMDPDPSANDLNQEGSGIVMDGASYVDLIGVKIFRCAEHGVVSRTRNYGGTIGPRTTNNVTMDDVTSLGNGLDGFNMFGGDSKFSSLVGGYNGRDGYNGGMGPISGSRFWNNLRFGVIAQGFGLGLSSSEIYDNAKTGVLLSSGSGHVITANKIYDNGRDGTGTGNDRAGVAIAEECGHFVISSDQFFIQNLAYRIAFYDTLTGGSGYTNGTYEDVVLLGGTGEKATADITVVGGVVTEVVLNQRGGGYTVGDVLTASGTIIGGGTGFSIRVSVTSYPFTGNMLYGISATAGRPRGTITGNNFDGVEPYNIDDSSLLFWEDRAVGSRDAAVSVKDEIPADGIVRAGLLSWIKDGGDKIPDMPGFSVLGVARPEHYGWRPSLTSELQTTICKRALEAGHSEFEFTEAETYLVDLLDATVTAPIFIGLKGTIKGSASTAFLNSLVVRLRTTTDDRFTISVDGFDIGRIDASQRENNAGEGSGSGLAIRLATNMSVRRLGFFGGDEGDDGFGDSGLVPEYCRNIVVDGCWFKGWDDHGIYVTGGPEDTPSLLGYDFKATNNHYEKCEAGALRLARDFRTAMMQGSTLVQCGKAIIVAGGQTNFTSAQKIIVDGNIATGCTNSVFDIRFTDPDTAVQVSNNQVYGWGTEIGNPAINLRGVSNALVFGNFVDFAGTTTGGTTAVYITSAMGDDGVFYTARNNKVFSNILRVREQGVTGAGTTVPNNKAIVDLTDDADIFDNRILNAYPYDIYTGLDGDDTSLNNPRVRRTTADGTGFNGAIPRAPLQVGDRFRVSRSPEVAEGVYDYDLPEQQYFEVSVGPGGALLRTTSPAANAKGTFYDAVTEGGGEPSSGDLFHAFRTNGVTRAIVNHAGQMGVGTTTPDPSAVLDLSDSGRGILVPRMSTTARNLIEDPANGLMIYNTSVGTFEFFRDGAWYLVGPGPQGERGPRGFRGLQGEQGEPGFSLEFALTDGTGTSLGDRPTTGSAEGATWGLIGAEESLTIYIWSDGAWYNAGTITSPAAAVIPNTIYVHANGNDLLNGSSTSSAVQTIERALELAAARPLVDGERELTLIDLLGANGDAETEGHLDMPDNTIIRAVHRAWIFRPAPGFEERNLFRMGSGCFIEGVLSEGFRVDSLTNPTEGFFASFRPGAVIRRVPYVHKIAVRSAPSWGLVPPPLDRANGNPAVGRGAGVVLADGAVCSQYSIFPNIMTWGATPVTPNGIGYCAKNGGLVNAVNAVSLWAHRHYLALSGGQIILSACANQFGDYSLHADGFRSIVVPGASGATLTVQSVAVSTIEAAQATIIDDMWDALVAGSYTTGWSADDEAYTRADAALFLQCVRWVLGYADETPMLNFAKGLFNTVGDPVFASDKLAAFVFSFEEMRDSINALSGVNSASQGIVTALVAALNDTLTDPQTVKEPSKITAIGHTWQNTLAGVALSKIPPAPGGFSIQDSILETNEGVVIATGLDDRGGALLARGPNGTLEIDPDTGLAGSLFNAAVRRIAIRTAISRSF